MITVCVESNYLLELAFLQEQSGACEEILRLAESAQVRLAIPAYCLGEPYERLARQAKRRRELHRVLAAEVHEMARSGAYAAIKESTRAFSALLIASEEQEKVRFEQAVGRLLKVATVIPLAAEVLAEAIRNQREPGLGPQDAIVLASTTSYLALSRGEKLFLNRNSRDFFTKEVRQVLAACECRLLTSFADALELIRHRLGRRGM